MIRKYNYGTPFETEAIVKEFEITSGSPEFGTIDLSEGFCFKYSMEETDIVYGLGEANRGINKRGYIYVSNNTDDPNHPRIRNLFMLLIILLSFLVKKPLEYFLTIHLPLLLI